MIVGLDLGTKRTGVAISQQGIAVEHDTITGDIDSINAYLRDWHDREPISRVVVGLPLHESGDPSLQADWVQSTAQRIQAELHIPIEYQEEHLTTVEAKRQLTSLGLRAAEVDRRLDQYAAKLILQQYLNENEVHDA